MSLSITINNINDLTDAERAVLRMIVGDKQVTLTGPTATRQFIESLVDAAPTAPTPASANGGYAIPLDSEVGKQFAAGVAAIARVPASAELDSAGLPFDKRIHSSSRAKVADGTWRKMRGVGDALVATVEAELRAVQAIPVPVPPVVEVVGSEAVIAVPSPDPDNRREVGEVVGAAAQAVQNGLNPTAPVPVSPAPTATLAEMQAKLAAAEELPQHPVSPATTPTPLTFADLMKHVTPMLVAGKLPQDKLLAITAEFGLPHLAALGARPDLVEAVRARIDEVVG